MRDTYIFKKLNLPDICRLVVKYDYFFNQHFEAYEIDSTLDIVCICVISNELIAIGLEKGIIKLWNPQTQKVEKVIDSKLPFYDLLCCNNELVIITSEKICKSNILYPKGILESFIGFIGNDYFTEYNSLKKNGVVLFEKPVGYKSCILPDGRIIGQFSRAQLYILQKNKLEYITIPYIYGINQFLYMSKNKIAYTADNYLYILDLKTHKVEYIIMPNIRFIISMPDNDILILLNRDMCLYSDIHIRYPLNLYTFRFLGTYDKRIIYFNPKCICINQI